EKAKQREREWPGATGPSSAEHYTRVVEALDRFPYLIDRIEPAKHSLRGEEFYELDRYREGLFLIDKWLELVSTLYFPTRMTVVDNQFSSYSIYSSKDIAKAIRDEEQNPYIELIRAHILPSILAGQPELVGVSITATSPIIPGLPLCRLIHDTSPTVHLTIGCSIFTRLVANLRRCASLFVLTDYLLVLGV